MTENEISAIIVDICFNIHHHLGPGLLESAYEAVLAHELAARGLSFERQVPIPLEWKGMRLDCCYRADIVVEQKVLIELKSVATLMPVHKKQLITYLRLMNIKLGILLNFNVNLIKDGIVRIVNGLSI